MKLRGKRCGVREKLERRKPNRAGLEFLLSSDYLWPLTPKFTFRANPLLPFTAHSRGNIYIDVFWRNEETYYVRRCKIQVQPYIKLQRCRVSIALTSSITCFGGSATLSLALRLPGSLEALLQREVLILHVFKAAAVSWGLGLGSSRIKQGHPTSLGFTKILSWCLCPLSPDA